MRELVIFAIITTIAVTIIYVSFAASGG